MMSYEAWRITCKNLPIGWLMPRFDDPMRLMRYSTNQLIEELARRAAGVPTRKPEYWCHDCKNFVAWFDKVPAPTKDCPENYNPCTKGHTMMFRAPEEYDDEYGFYRPVCADRDLPDNTQWPSKPASTTP